MAKVMGSEARLFWVEVLALSLLNFTKLHNLSRPQFPPEFNEDDNNSSFIRLL